MVIRKKARLTSVVNRLVCIVSAPVDEVVPSITDDIIGLGVGWFEAKGSADWEGVGHLSKTSAKAGESVQSAEEKIVVFVWCKFELPTLTSCNSVTRKSA